LFKNAVNKVEHLLSLFHLETSAEILIATCKSEYHLQWMLVVCTAVGAEDCEGSEKNQLCGATWKPDGGPAFIPVSNNVAISHFLQQPVQRSGRRSDEKYG